MPRSTNAVARRHRRNRLFKKAKGFYGFQGTATRIANNKVNRALAYEFVGRKQKKRDYRTMWNVRINAEARKNGTTYSQLIRDLTRKSIELDRKVLADIALHDPEGF